MRRLSQEFALMIPRNSPILAVKQANVAGKLDHARWRSLLAHSSAREAGAGFGMEARPSLRTSPRFFHPVESGRT